MGLRLPPLLTLQSEQLLRSSTHCTVLYIIIVIALA